MIAYPCPSLRKHRREEDRETYRGAIRHVDSAKVRSAVGLCRRTCLGYSDGRCQFGYFVALPRPLHEPHGTMGSSIVGFVKRSWYLCPGPSSLIHTHHFANIDGKRTAKRTEVRLGTLTARRYVPRSVYVDERTWVTAMFDTNAVTSSHYPRPLHEPYGTTGSTTVGFVKRSGYLLP